MANQNVRTGGGGLSSAMLAFLKLTPSPVTYGQFLHFYWPDAEISHQEVVEKMSKTNQNLFRGGQGKTRLTVRP